MRRFFTIIILIVCGVNSLYSQTLWDSIVEVKKLINEDNNDAAETILNRIEKQCMNTDTPLPSLRIADAGTVSYPQNHAHQGC